MGLLPLLLAATAALVDVVSGRCSVAARGQHPTILKTDDAAQPPPPLLQVSVRPAGGVTVRVGGAFWLSGDEVSVCASGRCYAKHAPGAAKLAADPVRQTSGADVLGQWNETTIPWRPADAAADEEPLFETSVRQYSGGEFYVLRQRWPRGCSNCSGAVGDANDVISAFPTFRPAADAVRKLSGPRLNFLNWGGNQLCDSTYGQWDLEAASVLRSNQSAAYPPAPTYVLHQCNYTYKGKCPLSYPYFNGTWVGGAQHGAPLVLYDEAMRALVVSPLDNFLVGQHTISRRLRRNTSDAATLPWAAGLGGLIGTLPAGFTHETVLLAGQGVRETMRRWGDTLLKAGGKSRPNWRREDDLVLSHIGYWTDRGSYYYGHPGPSHPDWSMEQTLQATQASLKAQGVPVRYFQFDDWWFQQTHGDFGGMHEWRPCHQTINGSSSYCSASGKSPVSVFPSGSLSFLAGKPPLSL
jgi:hypothetical protein